MNKIALFACVFLAAFTGRLSASPAQHDVEYYLQHISISYDAEMRNIPQRQFNLQSPEVFNAYMDGTDWRILYNDLSSLKEEMQLNDWLYYELVKKTTEQTFGEWSGDYRTMMDWYLLGKSGYKVRLFYDKDHPFLYVACSDRVYERSYLKMEDGQFLQLDENARVQEQNHEVYSSDGDQPASGKPFHLQLNKLPVFPRSLTNQQTLSFESDGKVYLFQTETDKSIMAMLKEYPVLDVRHYADFPMSASARGSLLGAWHDILRDKSEMESVRLILSFTRTAFTYKSDREAYGVENLVFAPEETLNYAYSDCEDRAILFSWMVRELLGLDVILIEYPTHISAAVSLPENQGMQVKYNDKVYTFCEPTGPQDVLKVGECPSDLRGENFSICQ